MARMSVDHPDYILPRPGIVADRLRAAAEFRRSGDLFDALVRVTYARNIRVDGREHGGWSATDDLALRLWRRHCRENHPERMTA